MGQIYYIEWRNSVSEKDCNRETFIQWRKTIGFLMASLLFVRLADYVVCRKVLLGSKLSFAVAAVVVVFAAILLSVPVVWQLLAMNYNDCRNGLVSLCGGLCYVMGLE